MRGSGEAAGERPELHHAILCFVLFIHKGFSSGRHTVLIEKMLM